MFTVIFIARLMFNIKIAGSLPLLLLLSIPFIVASLSIGLLISTLAKNQAQAMQMSTLTLLNALDLCSSGFT